MARPPKKRYVKHRQSYCEFGPYGADIDTDDDSCCTVMTIDQLEAMRLADLEAMSHNEAAEIMKISRQTFGRIIEQARQIVVMSLINGKVLRIESDACIQFVDREVKCIECGHEWMLAGDKSDEVVACENCGSADIIKRKRCGSFCECPLKVNK